MELSDSFKELDRRLKEYINNNIKDQQALNSLLSETQEALEKCENEKRSLKMLETKKEYRSDQEQNMNRQWKDIMKNLCNSFYEGNNQKINPIDCLKLIKHKKSVDCYDCLDAVKELLPDSLEILPEAFSSAKKHKDFNSDKIDQLFELLWKLGTNFRDRILQMTESGEEPRTCKAAKDIFGRRYSPQDGEYIIEYERKNLDIRQHLKIDSKGKKHGAEIASDNSCLRIHFAWHDKSKKVLIGHCGKHRG